MARSQTLVQGTGATMEVPQLMNPAVRVRGLRVAYEIGGRQLEVVHGIDLDVQVGETLGLVGESGSGKSTTLHAIAHLLPENAAVLGGSVEIRGTDLLTASREELRRLRGTEVAVLYQDALRALNPVLRVGRQIVDVLRAHDEQDGAEAVAIQRLAEVGIPEPELRAKSFPHQFSGGMRQRAMTALALALRPSVLLADEPTTALDVTIQAQVLDLLRHLADSLGSATILVSHDLGVVAGTCERVAVLYAGRVVETGLTEAVFAKPSHPYTAGLLRSVPRIDQAVAKLPFITGQPPVPGEALPGCPFAPRCPGADDLCRTVEPPLVERRPGQSSACHHPEVAATAFPVALRERDDSEQVASGSLSDPVEEGEEVAPVLIELSGGIRHYRAKRSDLPVRAVDGVDLEIRRGEFLGLVGESGCGKSTLGRILAGLDDLDEGDLTFAGSAVGRLRAFTGREFRRRSQLIFQDPRSSLDRRMSVGDQITEGLRNAGVPRNDRMRRVAELLELVGLPAHSATRLPGEFSGGQAQRVAIARALSVGPDLLIADEAVSSLDVSIKGQIVNLLRDLQKELDLSVLFISHDLGVVRQVADRVAVMYLGQFVEVAQTQSLFQSPRHPYTQALLSAIPLPDPVVERQRTRILLRGDVPSPVSPPPACRFHTRCQIGPCEHPERTRCHEEAPVLRPVDGSLVACHFAEQLRGSA